MRPAFLLLCFWAVSVWASAQPRHIYGIHDDTPMPLDWIARCPEGTAWITATEAIGSNPADLSGKNYAPPAGSKIIARLNHGYFPNGTIPVPEKYGDFATRCANFVSHSTNCDTWIIGNETNLAIEWPNDGEASLVPISPADYAACFIQCYQAIKAVSPEHQVLVQAVAPWAGPYGPGTLGSYSHPPQAENWVDYMYKVLDQIASGGVTPDGLAMHINSRGWDAPEDLFNGPYVAANDLTLNFSWLVSRDWIQFGLPRSLWHLPLYASESNGLYYWQGGGPENPQNPAYASGWLQAVYGDIHQWNRNAARHGLPIYRCINMYRWNRDDGWTIDGLPTELRSTVLDDLAAAASANYQWPEFGGVRLDPGTPGGIRLRQGLAVTVDSNSGEHPAGQAIDGRLDSWWTSDNAGPLHWLAVDLGTTQSLTGYVIRHASSAGESTSLNTRGFYIETSAAGMEGPWEIHTMVRTSPPGVEPPAFTSLEYSLPIQARYVRLFVNEPSTADHSARIAEFEIFAEATEARHWHLVR